VIWPPLWQVLSGACLWALLLRDWRMLRGSAALLTNWAILTAAASITGDQFHVPLNMAVDWATLVIGFAPLTVWPQALMALAVGTGMIFHVDHLLKLWVGANRLVTEQLYWDRFHYLAWAQAFLLIVWGVHGGACAVRRRVRHRGRVQAMDRWLLVDRPALACEGAE
jgi:hypothetical protein